MSNRSTNSRQDKRRPSITFDGEVPKQVAKSDIRRLPAIPHFEVPLKSLQVVEGENVTFNCKIRGNPHPTILWSKDGGSIVVPTERIWTETNKDGSHFLILREALPADGGSYRCAITNRLGKATSIAVLSVRKPRMTSQTIYETPTSKGASPVLHRNPEIIPCDPPTKLPLPTHSSPLFRRRISDVESTSSIHKTSSFDRRSLDTSSTASSPAISRSESIKSLEEETLCDVTSKRALVPQFVSLPQSRVVEEGQSVCFNCQIVGTPPPRVLWYKGAVPIEVTDRHTVEITSGKCTLKIEDLRVTDAARYRCVASNSSGKSSCSVELILTAKEPLTAMPRDQPPSYSEPLQPLDVRAGERAKFECRVEGRPKPKVEWYKDGKIVTASTRVRIMEVYGSHSLTISRSDHTDSGIYSVRAKNYLGSESCQSQLHVQDMSASRGSSSSQLSGYGLTGSTHSSPSTSSLSSPSLSPKLGRASLSRPVTGNAWGSGTKSTPPGRGGGGPQRRRGPGFILRPRPQTVAVGESLCLKCTLLGHPKPTVTWEKDGDLVDEDKTDGHIRTRIDGNDYFLEIDECGASDAGKYAVTARNSLGKQTAAIEVTVTGSNGSVNQNATKPPKSSTSPKTNGSIPSRYDEKLANNKQTIHSGDRTKKAPELIIPSNLKPDESKESPTSSVSSTLSEHSRVSTSSGTSRHDVDPDGEHRVSGRSNRRRLNLVAPTFLRRLSSTQVLEGEELLLQCEVSGNPDPHLVWLRNGLEVGIDEDEVFTSYRNGVARLRLRDVVVQHAGEYVCKARNDAGMVQCSSRVTVKAKRIEMRPRFLRSPSDVRAMEGETLTLEAEVEGIPAPEIVWSLDGEEVANGDALFSNNVARLILRNVTTASSGQYMCNALNSSGEDSVACRVRIKQKKNDIPPEFTAPLSDVICSEGDDVCLRCMVTGIPEPSVKWQFNQDVIEVEEGVEISFHDGVAALTLEQATEEDAGRYTCVAVNSEGQAKTNCNVTVKASGKHETKSRAASAPKFVTPFDEYIRTQEGDTLTVACVISGNPQPDVTWTLNDRRVENGSASCKDDKVTMTISPITSNHGGHIKCTLGNQAGRVSHEARIYVRSKRVAPAFESSLPATLQIVEGEEAYFECKVTGHPQPRVSWTRDGRSLSVLSTETSYEDGVAAVRIRKAGSRDSGRYLCVARNLSGEAESVCIVTFAEKEATDKARDEVPKFSKKLQDVTLNDGQDLQLKCHVTGNPVPGVTWEVDGQKIESEDGDARFKDGVATLVLEDAMPEDSGQYKCLAVNKAGKAECSCKVLVLGEKPAKPTNKEPSFPILLEDKTVKEGQDILLKCRVTGNPRPSIKWLLDGEEIVDAEVKYLDDGNIELLLTEALPDDEGVYTCIAENLHKRVMCSCKVTIEVPPKVPKKKSSLTAKRKEETVSRVETDSSEKPVFLKMLEDCVIEDGSTNVSLSCRVSGNPTVRWFLEGNEIEESDDFKFVSDGDVRKLIFTEVFPEDSGSYTCLIKNTAGEATSSCSVTVQEVEGDQPTFLMKPKPLNVNAGERATFSCRVDGDPVPAVQWLFCNQPIQGSDRLRLTEGNASNNYTHSMEIAQVAPQDAGRYSVCCRNLLGDVTCTVSLIVGDAKKQEAKKDFRDVLRKPTAVKTTSSGKQASEDNVDFRGVLRKASTDKDVGRIASSGSEDASEDPTVQYKEALSTSVKTKALTEEERKAQKAEQVDFRSQLVRKVDTKVVTQDTLRTKGTDQLDFRDEALKTQVKTKVVGQEDLKAMRAEQKDFRGETLKSKVVTKAFREEQVKAKRAEQVDFRNLLSPTKREQEKSKDEEEGFSIANIPKAKWKKEADHTTVAMKRSRHRGASSIIPERKVPQNGDEQDDEAPSWSTPDFTKYLEDISTNDGEPFELECHVTGDPRPEITWFLGDEEIKAEADINISYEGNICHLSIAESFPEDQGKYTCTATNEHGQASSTCHVTVVGDGE